MINTLKVSTSQQKGTISAFIYSIMALIPLFCLHLRSKELEIEYSANFWTQIFLFSILFCVFTCQANQCKPIPFNTAANLMLKCITWKILNQVLLSSPIYFFVSNSSRHRQVICNCFSSFNRQQHKNLTILDVCIQPAAASRKLINRRLASTGAPAETEGDEESFEQRHDRANNFRFFAARVKKSIDLIFVEYFFFSFFF